MRNIFFQAASVAASVTVATTVSVVMVPEAHAASITRTIGGVSYDITEVQGSIFDLLPTLERQVWWGNDSLAREFAVAAGANWGPAPFAFDYGSVQVFFGSWQPVRTLESWGWSNFSGDYVKGGIPTLAWGASGYKFATATPTAVTPPSTTPIPTPALLPGLVGFGVSALRKRNANPEASTDA